MRVGVGSVLAWGASWRGERLGVGSVLACEGCLKRDGLCNT